jgi:hypothetical protein
MQPDKTDRDEVHRLATEAGFKIWTDHLGNVKITTSHEGQDNLEIEVERLINLVKAKELDAIAALINDDAAAISYQSLAKYRSALLQAIRARKDK